MEEFRSILLYAKVLTRKCKNREVVKLALAGFEFLGIINSLLEFSRKRSELLNIPEENRDINSLVSTAKNLISVRIKKPPPAAPLPSKFAIEQIEPPSRITENMDESPIILNNGMIIANFNFACYIARIYENVRKLSVISL